MTCVVQQREGKWFATVYGREIGPFETNAEAWRALGQMGHEPLNRAEQTTDWSITQHLRGK